MYYQKLQRIVAVFLCSPSTYSNGFKSLTHSNRGKYLSTSKSIHLRWYLKEAFGIVALMSGDFLVVLQANKFFFLVYRPL